MSNTSVMINDQAADEAPASIAETLEEDSQFAIAMRRILSQDCPVDPQSAVAPFNSAF